MAEQIKQALEKEVTCPLCLDLFKEPKKLSCDHVYCKECLKGLALHQQNLSISCPECRTVVQIPNNDIGNFPTAFRMNRLVEAYQEAREETDHHKHATESLVKSCTVHTAQPLALYCETCKAMLCRDCVIMTKDHVEHKYDYIGKVAEKYRQKHEKRLQMTTEFKEQLSQVYSQISKVGEKIASKETADQEKIDRAFKELYNTLEESKRSMKRQLSQESQSALGDLLKHKRETESIQAETTHVITLIDGILQGKDEALLSQEELVAKNVKKLQKQVEQFPQTVSEPILPVPEIMNCETLQKYLDASNFLYIPADPKKCHVEGGFLKIAKADKYYVFTVNVVDSKGNRCSRESQKIKAELSSIRDDTKIQGRIEYSSQFPENVNIVFESQKRGRYELSVTMRGVHIANSPQSMYVYMPPSQLGQPIAQIRNLQRPTGITQCGNNILAVEHSRNRILKFNTSFKAAAVYGEGQLRGPSELTTDQHMNIYVCAALDDRVHKFTSYGIHVKSIGMRGTLPGQFNFPNGIRVNNQEELYICDSENNRIQVFNLQLGFKRVFGGPGSGKGQFSGPSDVDFDNSGNIYVTDTNNHRIQVFTPQERFFQVIGYKRFGSSELKSPVNMHIINDLLFVTEFKKNHVTVFKTSGELITIFGKGILEDPEGIEIDADGYVYVTSHYSTIFVF